MSKGNEEFDLEGLLGGTLNILGFKLNLGELLASPERFQERLEELREKLKEARGGDGLSDEEGRLGNVSVSGYIRTGGLLGEREFHVGTMGKPFADVKGKARERATGRRAAQASEEPPVDVIQEVDRVTVVADVPGVELGELKVKLEGDLLTIGTTEQARRRYRKVVRLEGELNSGSMKVTCHNGVLEVDIRRGEKRAGEGRP